MCKTVILGATTNESRYAYLVAERLYNRGMDFVPVGRKSGNVFGETILDIDSTPHIEDVHTITLYIGSKNQVEWYTYIISLKPKRIIFNPGTENKDLVKLAEANDIEVEVGCTLVMLSIGNY